MHIDLSLSLKDIIIEQPELTEKYQRLFNLGHFGTHIDLHLGTEIPLAYFQTRGILFDVRQGQQQEISLKDFEHSQINPGDFVIFRTGQLETTSYGTQAYFYQHPQLSFEVIDYLIEKKIHFIGIDAAGVRRGAEHVIADKKCEQHRVYIVENLNNLQKLSTDNFVIFTANTSWFDMPNRTGLPCRVIATL